MVNIRCNLCGSNSYTIKYEIQVKESNFRFYRYARNVPNKDKMTGVFNIVTCNSCGLMYANPRFSTEELNIVYSSNTIIGGKYAKFNYLFNSKLPDELQTETNIIRDGANKWKFDIIDKYVENNSATNLKLLDIGCGNGRFVFDAIEKGFNAFGIDMSPDRINEGRQLYGLSDQILKHGNIDKFSSNDKYDVITLFDVIEHVEDPSGLMAELKKISHKNTKIFMLTMSLDSITYKLFKKKWNYINPTQHLHYFSHNTMEQMLNKNGFNLIDVEMDGSKNKNFIHLVYRIVLGQINYFFYKVYKGNNPLKLLFKPFQGEIDNERMKKRLENLYPGMYVGRYHDNFVFISQPV